MNIFVLMGVFVFFHMLSWYIISLILKRNDVVDIAWGLGFINLAWASLYISGFSERGLLATILVTIWGLRLAWHIYLRNRGKSEDYRYQAWRKEWKFFYARSFFQIYMLQGLLMYLIAVPVMYINTLPVLGIGLLDIVGVCIWIIGFYFESTGDSQLKKFISNPNNKGKIMNTGLWRYSRHPNYFGEVTQWWGIFFLAISLPYGFATIIGPLTITTLILFVSGIPLLEKKREGRPDWEEYKKKTSIFFPLPQKK